MVRFEEIERLTRSERRWTRVAISVLTLFFTIIIVLLFEIRRQLLYNAGRNITLWCIIAAVLLIIGAIVIFIKLRLKEIRMTLLHKFYDEE